MMPTPLPQPTPPRPAPTPRRAASPGRRHRKWLFPLFALIIPLAIAEIGLRVYDAARGADARARAHWYWAFDQDRFLGYRPRPNIDIVFAGGENRFDSNSVGLRDDETPIVGAPGRRLIVCLGESSTWGTGCTDRSTTWPNDLERLLRERGWDDVVVLNAGVPGYTTVENLQFLKLGLLKYEPELVLYMGFRNDVVEYGALDDSGDFNRFPRRLAALPRTPIRSLLMRSSLVAALYSSLGGRVPLDSVSSAQPRGKSTGTLSPRGDALLRDQIALFAELCARHEVRLAWIDQPIDRSRAANLEQLDIARATVHEELDRAKVPLLEANGAYDYAAVPMLDDVHFSDAGNAQLAELLAPQVEALLRASPAAR